MVFLAVGRLPWLTEDGSLVLHKKLECTADDVCYNLPSKFYEIYTYIRGLTFEEVP
jgi:hypothetical protein